MAMPTVTSQKPAWPSKAGPMGHSSRIPAEQTGLPGRIHRLLKLATMLQSGRNYDTPLLAEELGVSRRTVFRYLDVLRSVGMDFVHDPQMGGYQAKPGSLLRPVDFNLTEALALLLASRGVRHSPAEPSIPLLRAAASAALKIESVLPGPVQEYCRELINKIIIHPVAAARHKHTAGFFEMIQKAIHQKRKLKMVYRSLAERERIETTLSVYRLLFCQRAWYVVGYSSLHKSVRTFKLLRIYQLKLLDKLFVPDKDFDLEKFFGYAWSMIPEGKLHRVVLRFSRKVANNVAEVLWHKTQQLEWLRDGSLVLRATVDGLTEISWWVLGYGAEVEVMAPAALRNRIAGTAEKMLDTYKRKPK